MNWIKGTVLGVLFAVLSACQASYHTKEVRAADERSNLTAGVVQREISKGMSSAEVAEVLGAPNVVSTDPEGREVWVYDKMSREVVASESRWFVSAGAASSRQRTLTIIIKFDEAGHVRDLAYRQTSF